MSEPSYWQEYRKCGKANCPSCPHGPYWFGRVEGRKRYFGRVDPRPCATLAVPFPPGSTDIGAAAIVLGIGLWQQRRTCEAIYAIALAQTEGDAPSQVERRERLIRAWQVVCAWHEWTAENRVERVVT